MTPDDIIKLAKQAGGTEIWPYDYGAKPDQLIMRHEALQRFAALFRAAALEEAARVCEQMQNGWASDDHMTCAAAIRQLKDKT